MKCFWFCVGLLVGAYVGVFGYVVIIHPLAPQTIVNKGAGYWHPETRELVWKEQQ